MFERILVATDLSEASDYVIGCLSSLRALGSKEAILCYALGLRHLEVLKYELARQAEPRLLSQKALLERQGFRASVEVLPLDAGWEINRLAAEKDASLIVAGSHSRPLASRVFLGHVAFDILSQATRPVLLVRLKFAAEDESRCQVVCSDLTRHILFPTDFSDTAERAFSYVEDLVERGAKAVTLLHVQEQARIEEYLKDRLEEFNRMDRARLERLRQRLVEKGATDVQIDVPYGFPVREILQRARREDGMLIVMGSQGKGFISELFLGSVSLNVARYADKPVLMVPALR